MPFSRWGWWLFAGCCFVVLFLSLGMRALWGSEGRWAEVTREMFLTGDFFHPMIGQEPYFDKPLLTYWFIAGLKLLTGVLNEFVVRLPSALAGLVAILATMNVGKRLWSTQVGWLSGWFMLTSYGVFFWSRTGAADTENMAAIILAVAWYWAKRDKLSFGNFLVFFLIIFVGALTKGLTAVVVSVLIILPDILIAGRWRILLKPALWLAMICGVLVYMVPFVVAAVTRPGGYNSSGLWMVFHENVMRYFEAFDHKNPFYIYFYCVPLLVLPWAGIFVSSVIAVPGQWKKLDYNTRWLLKAMALVFVFFTLSGSRRSYYILPIVPLCSLLMAVFVIGFRGGEFVGIKEAADIKRFINIRRVGMVVQKYIIGGCVVAELLLPFVLVVVRKKTGFAAPVDMYVSGVVIAVVALIVGWVVWKLTGKRVAEGDGNNAVVRLTEQNADASKSVTGSGACSVYSDIRLVWVMMAMLVVVLVGFQSWQQGIMERYRTEKPFAVELSKAIKANDSIEHDRVVFWHKNDAKLLFYMNSQYPAKRIYDKNNSKEQQKLRDFLSVDKPAVVISEKRYLVGKYISGDLLQVLGNDSDRQLAEKVVATDSKSKQQKKWVACFIRSGQGLLNK